MAGVNSTTWWPAYACTIHKSQGSDIPRCGHPFSPKHYAMLQRNLVYTRHHPRQASCGAVGQKKALAMAVEEPLGRRVTPSWREASADAAKGD